uniref:Uncharacterized protein n=1 Tax=Oryza meridionalis TaxID=40149 RepID=A0A0G2KBP2_9ORYZ
MLRRWNLV